MRNRLMFLLCLTLVLAGRPRTGRAGEQAEPAALPETQISTYRNEISAFLGLRLTQAGLHLNREAWGSRYEGLNEMQKMKKIMEDLKKNSHWGHMDKKWLRRRALDIMDEPPVIAAFKRLQQAVQSHGHGGGSGSSGGNDYRSFRFSSGEMSGGLMLRNQTELCFRFMDESGGVAPRMLAIKETGEGDFDLFIFLGAKGPFLSLSQKTNGAIEISHFADGKMITLQGRHFDEVLNKHKAYVEEQFFPMIKHVGVGLPACLDPKQIEAVLALLRADAKKGSDQSLETLFKKLDDKEFAVREAASKNLIRRGPSAEKAIKAKLKDKAISEEVRSRLEEIVEKMKVASDQQRKTAGMKLHKDPDFLIRIYPRVKEAKDKTLVLQQLQALIGTDLGADIALWKAWWAKNWKAWYEKRDKAEGEADKDDKAEG